MDMLLQKALLGADLLPTEKLVGMVVAFHIHPKQGCWRIGQAAIAHECGVSIPTVKRAVSSLIKAGFITVKRTGRTAKYYASVKCHIKVEGSPVIHQKDHSRSIKRAHPWELDTQFSTRAEEEYKRLLHEEDGNGER